MKRNKLLLCLIGIIMSLWVTSTQAQVPPTRKAVKSGNWNNTATWGRALPASNEEVIIPAGITVTIPAGYSLTNVGNIDGKGVTVAGALVVSGKLAISILNINAGASFTNNSTGQISMLKLFINYGVAVNKGSIVSSAPWAYNYATFTNEAGAVIDNRGEFSTSSTNRFTNRGTITNNFSFNFYSPTDNYGTITNGPGRQMGIYREFHNFGPGKISNLGQFIIHGCCKTSNDGAIDNKGTSFQNDGGIENSCTGNVTGTAVTGKAPIKNCPPK